MFNLKSFERCNVYYILSDIVGKDKYKKLDQTPDSRNQKIESY